MGNFSFCLLLFLSFHYLTAATADTAVAAVAAALDPTAAMATTPFIKAACQATRYYALCVRCLSTFANKIQQSERQLARAALAVTLSKAQSTAMFVTKLSKSRGIKPRESQALRDCLDNMADSVDQLNQSMQELGQMNRVAGQDFMWHMSNVQTWVSAALTDENTCLDGFSGSYLEGNVKAAIRRRVVYVAQVTSNALALVNLFAARHRPGSNMHAP